MKKTLAALGVAALLGVTLCQSAQAQFSEHRVGRHKVVKCYRELVLGPYRCHTYYYW